MLSECALTGSGSEWMLITDCIQRPSQFEAQLRVWGIRKNMTINERKSTFDAIDKLPRGTKGRAVISGPDSRIQTKPAYAESIFSRLNDSVSETSKSSYDNIRTAQDELVRLFLSDDELNHLFVTAIEDPNIGGQRLERSFERLLVTYSEELLSLSQVDDVYREAAKLVWRRAPFIAEDILQHIDPTGRLATYHINTNQDDEAASKRELFNKLIYRGRFDAHFKSRSTRRIPDKNQHYEGREHHDRHSEFDESSNISKHQHNNGGTMTSLEQVKYFLRAGHPLENLRTNLRRFVVPNSAVTTRDNMAHRDELSEITHENRIEEDSNNFCKCSILACQLCAYLDT